MGAEQREQKSEPSHACERPAVQSQEDQGAAGARRYMYFLSCASRVVFVCWDLGQDKGTRHETADSML